MNKRADLAENLARVRSTSEFVTYWRRTVAAVSARFRRSLRQRLSNITTTSEQQSSVNRHISTLYAIQCRQVNRGTDCSRPQGQKSLALALTLKLLSANTSLLFSATRLDEESNITTIVSCIMHAARFDGPRRPAHRSIGTAFGLGSRRTNDDDIHLL